jgi:virulence-associated protein VagC
MTAIQEEAFVMATVRIQKQIDSATLTLPELQPFVGKTVEIIVRERNGATISPGTGNWQALQDAAEQLEDYDFDAWRLQRERDQQHVVEPLP